LQHQQHQQHQQQHQQHQQHQYQLRTRKWLGAGRGASWCTGQARLKRAVGWGMEAAFARA
jgi:hypothetical protein